MAAGYAPASKFIDYLENNTEEYAMILKYNKNLYSKAALIKAAYNFIDRAYLHLDCDEKYYYVDIVSKQGESDVSEEEFSNEMLTQSARHEVYIQTKNIRELLMARAFSTSLITDKKTMTGENTPAEKYSEDEILKDWFDGKADE